MALRSFKPPVSDPTLPSAPLWKRLTDAVFNFSLMRGLAPIFVDWNHGIPTIKLMGGVGGDSDLLIRLDTAAAGNGVYYAFIVTSDAAIDPATDVGDIAWGDDGEMVVAINLAEREFVVGETSEYTGHAYTMGDAVLVGPAWFANRSTTGYAPLRVVYFDALPEGCPEDDGG